MMPPPLHAGGRINHLISARLPRGRARDRSPGPGRHAAALPETANLE